MTQHETEQIEEVVPETTDAGAGTEGAPPAERAASAGDAGADESTESAAGAPAAEGSDEQMAGAVDDKAVELMGESRGHAQGEDPIADAEELLDGLDMKAERRKVEELQQQLKS